MVKGNCLNRDRGRTLKPLKPGCPPTQLRQHIPRVLRPLAGCGGARRWLCFLESIHCYFQKHKQMQMSPQTLHNEMQGEDSLSKSLNSPSKQV